MSIAVFLYIFLVIKMTSYYATELDFHKIMFQKPPHITIILHFRNIFKTLCKLFSVFPISVEFFYKKSSFFYIIML